jgi:hypothetical protein
MKGHESQAKEILLSIQEINFTIIECFGDEFKRNSCLLIEYYRDHNEMNLDLKNFDEAFKLHNECIKEILNLGLQNSYIYVKEKYKFFF